MKIKQLTPTLETLNLLETIKFYQENFDFECRGIYPPENPCWASLWNGDMEIAFSSNKKEILMSGSIYFSVENVDEVWERIKDKVEIVYPLENMSYGMREFGIKDCNGYVLNIGQEILEN